MADINDVQLALVSLIEAELFAPGYSTGLATVSTLGPTVRVYPGWPNPASLDADLAAGTVNVSVFPDPGMASLTTRYSRVWKEPTVFSPTTFIATTNGTDVTFSGTLSPDQAAAIRIGNNPAVGYRLLAGDTAATVASALAAKLTYASPTVNGATISFPNITLPIIARTGRDQIATMETRRQKQQFRITVWAPNPVVRAQIASAIDVMMSDVRFINFPDGSCSSIPEGRGTYVDDVPQTENLFRRDLRYAIEYPTLKLQAQPPFLFANLVLDNAEETNINLPPVAPGIGGMEFENDAGYFTTEDGRALILEYANEQNQ